MNHAVLNCTLVCVSLEQGCCVLLLAVSLMDNGLAIWVRPHFPAPFVAHLCGGPVKGVKVCYCKCDQHHRERLSCFFLLETKCFCFRQDPGLFIGLSPRVGRCVMLVNTV